MDLGLSGRTAVVCASTGGLGVAVARALGRRGRSGRRVRTARRPGRRPWPRNCPSPSASRWTCTARAAPTARRGRGRRFGPIDILVLNGPGPSPGRRPRSTDEVAAAAFAHRWCDRSHGWSSLALPGMRARAGDASWRSARAGWSRRCPTWPCPTWAAPRWPATSRPSPPRSPLDGGHREHAAARPHRHGPGGRARPGRRQAPGTTAEESQVGIPQDHPARRYGEPEEFGAAAAFLCSAPASYITGMALRCDGGLVRSTVTLFQPTPATTPRTRSFHP